MKNEPERRGAVFIVGRPAQFRRIRHPGLIEAHVDASGESLDGLDVRALRVDRAHVKMPHQIEREACRHLAGEYASIQSRQA